MNDRRDLPRPGSFRAFLMATRPATLTAAFAPVAAGTAVALQSGQVRLWPGLAALVGAFLLQITSNLANDVFDAEKGADTEERLGPVRAVQAGLVSARAMKIAMAISVALSLLVGSYLAYVSGWVIVVIGLAAIVSAIAYTGGPYPLGYHGLGDVFVMLFFGFVAVCGTTFVHLGFVPPLAFLVAFALGATATNILVVNNVRDRHTDRQAGKRTLAVRLGREGAELEYIGLYGVAYLVPLFLFAFGWVGPLALLPLLTLPKAVALVRRMRTEEGRSLNKVLVDSAKLVFFHGTLLALGLAGDALLG